MELFKDKNKKKKNKNFEVKINFSVEKIIDLNDYLEDYFENMFYDENGCGYSQSREKEMKSYVSSKMNNLTEKDIQKYFESVHESESDMLYEFVNNYDDTGDMEVKASFEITNPLGKVVEKIKNEA